MFFQSSSSEKYTAIQGFGGGKLFLLFKVSYAHKGSIYLIKNIKVKTVVLWKMINI